MEQKALKCMEINQTLLYKQLPAHMIVTNFIAGAYCEAKRPDLRSETVAFRF